MKELQSFGAAGEVTGSCHVLTDNKNRRVLVDFGMFQGTKEEERRNFDPLGFNPSELDGVVVTHAHLDHTGNLPRLSQAGYSGRIYMTEPTAQLTQLVLADSAKIIEANATRDGKPPLYDSSDVAKVLAMIQTVPLDQEFYFGNFAATFREAGHILGSASIEMTERRTPYGETIFFSGDLGNDNPNDIVRAKTHIDRADIVVMETTYGDREHSAESPEKVIQEEINAIEKRGGTLLIPAFSIERTQLLLKIIKDLKEERRVGKKTRVIHDSPLGMKATNIFTRYKDSLHPDLSQEDNPFDFDGLILTPCARQSREIDSMKGPKVIIAGSGMMNGGRIRQHAINYLSRPSTRILFPGYQAEESLGRQIQAGAREVVIDDIVVPVNASVASIGSLSAHADQGKLMEWVSNPEGVRKAVLVHGGDRQREVFSGKVRQELGIDVSVPQRGQKIDLSYN